MSEDLKDVYWLIGYDLPAETREGLNDDQKAFVNTMRMKVYRQLKESIKATPIQDSTWVIRDPKLEVSNPNGDVKPVVEAMRDYLDVWRKEYSEKGYDINMELFPIATNDMGTTYIKKSELAFIFEQMLGLEKKADRYAKEKKCRTRIFHDMEVWRDGLRAHFIESFGLRHERAHEFEQIYTRVKDKMEMKLRKILVS